MINKKIKTNLIGRINNYIKQWTLFEKVWLVTFTLVNIYLFFAWSDTWVGLTASLTGMLCVILTAKAKISSFYWGLINILTYSYVAYGSAYYGDVMLNMLYFLPMTFLGIYYWNRNMRKEKEGKVLLIKSLNWKNKIFWFLVSIVIIWVYGLFLKFLHGTLPFVDSLTTIFSIVATIMLTKRITDQWIYWIMVDVFSIVMWGYIFLRDGNQVSMLVMWSAYLVNACYGYYNWRKMEKRQHGK